MLIVFGGLPGTGKTTLARLLGKRLCAMHLRIDTIEQALRSSVVVPADIGDAGYRVAYAVAEDNLRIGGTVVADSVNPLKLTRDAWLAVAERAGVDAVEIEVIRSDVEDHRLRVETRIGDIAGLVLPTWADVKAREYDLWDRPRIVIDTSGRTAEESLGELLGSLNGRRSRIT